MCFKIKNTLKNITTPTIPYTFISFLSNTKLLILFQVTILFVPWHWSH